jgi:putative nucleotidyltransferase with HDIG domain
MVDPASCRLSAVDRLKRTGGPADSQGVKKAVVLVDPRLEESLTAHRGRRLRNPVGREVVVRVSLAVVFLIAAILLVTFADTVRQPDWWLYPTFAVMLAFSASIRFEAGVGSALPTELAFAPMLFVLPAKYVPLVVFAGMALVAGRDLVRGKISPRRALVWPAVTGFFALGPALVIVAAGEPEADGHSFTILLLALAVQFGSEIVVGSLAAWSAYESSAFESALWGMVRPLAWTFLIDALLAPVGYVAAIAARFEVTALLAPFPLLGLLAIFAAERRQRLDSMLELSSAYRGTALLLGDVVEADDAYTGHHSRQVVELVLEVADRVRLDPEKRRLAEFAAMLHDVGKIRIPAEIIEKPGPLTADERAIVNTHTIEGEQLLRRVGGLLEEVGAIVRSCHERWDGGGYPDRLVGEQTPLISRIICCCDAYNAMTTDRPYRKALAHATAVAELQAHRGTQFDPEIVDIVIDVLDESRGRALVTSGHPAASPSFAI